MNIFRNLKIRSGRLIRNIAWLLRRGAFSDFNELQRAIVPPSSPSHGDSVNYCSDGLVILNNCDCLTEPAFKKAYQDSLSVNDWRGKNGEKFDMRFRYYVVCWFAEYASSLQGDYVECGVYKGGYSKAILSYLRFEDLDKTFHLFDTFNGLDTSQISPEERRRGIPDLYGHYEDVYDEVVQLFPQKYVKLHKGSVPSTLEESLIEDVAYLSIDMNNATPEIAAANFFWDKLVPGAVLIIDDYGFAAHKAQKDAFDAFAKEKGVSILSLPTAQGIILKPHT